MTIAKIALATLFCAGFLAATPAAQAEMRTVGGQAYWTGDPGPVEPGAYWASGQYKYDPDHYLSYYGDSPQDYTMVVHANHMGAANCVWRKRVVNTDWEFRHPYLMVCRH
jgi:hypothetical protein